MKKINKHIEIVRSSTVRLSSMSRKSCDGIYDVLTRHYAHVDVTMVDNLLDLEALVDRQPDLVFLGMNLVLTDQALGIDDPNKIWITDYLEAHGIAFTGSRQPAQELELYKPLAKQRAFDAGLQTSPFQVINHYRTNAQTRITVKYPLFIKPASCGGGLGVDSNSLVNNKSQLLTKVQSISQNYHADSLIEEYLPGREFSVAVLQAGGSENLLAMPIELIAPLDQRGSRILSGQIKSSDTEKFLSIEEDALKTRINTLAINIFQALGARDYGRIDIRLDKFGEPNFLEANLLPSLVDGYGNFPKACKLNMGINHETAILRIVELGLSRNPDVSFTEKAALDTPLLSFLEPEFELV